MYVDIYLLSCLQTPTTPNIQSMTTQPTAIITQEINDENEEIDEKTTTTTTTTTATPLIYSQQASPSQRNILGSPILETQTYDIFNPDKYINGDKLYKYDYKDLHNDLEKQHFAGVYGWDNACYWGIAEKKANTDLTKHYSKRHSV